MEKSYREGIKAFEKAAAHAAKIEELAYLINPDEKSSSTHNALQVCERAIKDYVELRREAKELGTTPSNALKSYRMRKKSSDLIPEFLEFAPPHWIQGPSVERIEVWKDGKRVHKLFKTREVTAPMAQRLRAGLQRELERIFSLLNEKEWHEDKKQEFLLEIEESYKNDSYREFSETVSRLLWWFSTGEDVEEGEGEEESTLPTSSEEFKQCEVKSSIYSPPIREFLSEWARDKQLRFNKSCIMNWATCSPNSLFSHLIREYYGCDNPVNDWIMGALTSLELASGSFLNWSDQVSFDMLDSMIRGTSIILNKGGPWLTHEDIVGELRDECLRVL